MEGEQELLADSDMKLLDADFVKDFIRIVNNGWKQGWHERDCGDLSYRVKPEEVEMVKEYFIERDWQSVGTFVPKLAGEYFLVTGSGKFFRNVSIKPEDTIGMIELDEKGENYRIVWGLVNNGRPISELSARLLNHEVKKMVSGGKHRVIYYAHTTNVITISYALPLNDEVFTKELKKIASDSQVAFPDCIGVTPWTDQEAGDVAISSSKLMKQYDVVIWPRHGMIASGENVDSTFEVMYAVENAADSYVKMISVGQYILQSLPRQN